MLSGLILLCLLGMSGVLGGQWYAQDSTDTDLWALREKDGHRMALVLLEFEDQMQPKMLECQLVGHEVIIHEVLKNIHASKVKLVEHEDMTRIITECIMVQQAQAAPGMESTMKSAIRSNIGDWITSYFIVPGTKWCGAGDIAENYDDLGTEIETDKCCRTHDHCNDTMEARGEKYGLKNAAVHTKCHCDCDTKFYDCLIKAGTSTASTVGNFFFNKLQVQCFKKDHPIIRCNKYHNWAYMFYSCQEYELDNSQPPIWQFFDAKYFEMPSASGSQAGNNTADRRPLTSWLWKRHMSFSA